MNFATEEPRIVGVPYEHTHFRVVERKYIIDKVTRRRTTTSKNSNLGTERVRVWARLHDSLSALRADRDVPPCVGRELGDSCFMKTSTTSSVTYCISTGSSRDTTTPMRSRYRLRSQRKTRASQWCLRRAASHERRTAARTRLWLDGYLRWQHALGGPLREQRAQLADAVLRVCKQVRLHLVSVARGCSGEWKHGMGWLFEMEQPAPAAASSPFSAARRVPETARRGGRRSVGKPSEPSRRG